MANCGKDLFCRESVEIENSNASTDATSCNSPNSMFWLFDKQYSNQGGTISANWSIYRTFHTETNKKKYFRCNRVKVRGEHNVGTMYLLYDATKEKVIRLRTSRDNKAAHKSKADEGLPKQTREELENLFSWNIKPESVLESLSKLSKLPMPSKADLNSYLTSLRKEKLKPGKINPITLAARFRERTTLPSNEHASFIVSYQVSSPKELDATFRLFITTKYLIGIARNAKIIHVSAKYNLFWQSHPIYILGTTDKDSKFHPFGLSVTKGNQVEDFKFIFNAFKGAVLTYHKIEITPIFLLCNAEPNIEEAFVEVFGPDAVLLTCWSYVRRNIMKLVFNLIEPSQRTQILSDIDTLQLAASKEIFQRACQLFLEKWQYQRAFCTLFISEWLDKNQNWFEGAANGFPSKNSGLEAFNNAIKNSNALKVRLTLENFLTKSMGMVSDWSNQYRIGTRRVIEAPTISQRLWVESYQWSKQPKNILKCGNKQNYTLYRVPANENLTSMERFKSWSTFDSFKEVYFNECHVMLPLQKQGWINGTCSCPTYSKMFICKHILGMAITFKEVKVPSNVRIEQNAKKPAQQTSIIT